LEWKNCIINKGILNRPYHIYPVYIQVKLRKFDKLTMRVLNKLLKIPKIRIREFRVPSSGSQI